MRVWGDCSCQLYDENRRGTTNDRFQQAQERMTHDLTEMKTDFQRMYQMQLTFLREHLALLKQQHSQHIDELNQ